MSAQPPIADREARRRALDPAESFIVQAPAGSGKTGLLTQRFLKLLGGAEVPEEIVAITFTRKAAGEMRQRILEALTHARDGTPPKNDYERETLELARAALERDRGQEWQLLDNPSRLHVQTIDSLCARLARQMPILSRFGALPGVAEDAEPLYREAASNTLAQLESNSPWSDEIAHLVLHVDNRLDLLQELIASMLRLRDQWLPHLASPDNPQLGRRRLEDALAHLASDLLGEVAAMLPEEVHYDLVELARFAGANAPIDSTIAELHDVEEIPGADAEDLPTWRNLVELLLTKEGTWRRSFTAALGFPPQSAARSAEERSRLSWHKERMAAVTRDLEGRELLREKLRLLRILPPLQYEEDQWRTLAALASVLRIAAAHLELCFSERGQVDFAALLQAANRALGSDDDPTDLALALDYRIRHLLVDEFQDTSAGQFELLRRLTAGWQPDDGHTLFVVGDPMQSIYRFREANVGLFLEAKDAGIGHIPLTFLRLEVNFRSQAGIVEWLNRSFPQVMAQDDNTADGAIAFAPSVASHAALSGQAVTVHPFLERDDGAEAETVVSIARRALNEFPGGTTAVLVRNRTHLVGIVARLRRARIPFQAVELERLAQRPVIQDLFALTAALWHRGDRIAWLALLRAPWCGLLLADLFAIAGAEQRRTIVDLLHDETVVAHVSQDGHARIARILPAIDHALVELDRRSLRESVEGLWLALGGPACTASATDLEDSEVFFQLLEDLEQGAEPLDAAELVRQVDALFAQPDVGAGNALQLMTIHKAKGLEFDTVILPGLGRGTRSDSDRLLRWLERRRAGDDVDLILAPMSPYGEERNAAAYCLQQLDIVRDRHEQSRLAYVACTRAKARLHLLGQVNVSRKDASLLQNPRQDSLLARLWSALEPHFAAQLDRPPPERPGQGARGRNERMRIATDWTLPLPPSPVAIAALPSVPPVAANVEFDWAGETARHLGTVAHRLLQYIARLGVEQVSAADLARLARFGRNLLASLGVHGADLEDAAIGLERLLEQAMSDERGRWILSGNHPEAAGELALTSVRGGTVDRMIIDRTFVAEDGTRWIVDYKTGSHAGGGVEEFLDREVARYRPQLERYAAAFADSGDRPIRLGLYFPALPGWREWAFMPGGA